MPASPRSLAACAGVLFCAGLTQASGASLQTIYNFRGGADGEYPSAALALRKDGAIFGTTTYGGGKHRGTVFMLTPPSGGQTGWNEAVIADFAKNNHGKTPAGGVIAVGNTLFGTATYRGGPSGCGTDFSVHDGKAKGWTIQTIWQSGARRQAMGASRAGH